jgi:4-amino-4-deoxy-L-arabinose transferase-like glycosyltransferase
MAIAIPFYALGLDWSPPYLVHDEIVFALQAHAIATTLHDLKGRLLPLYFQGLFWATPVDIYLAAIVLKAAPISVVSVRIISALVGVIDVGLMFLVAHRLFKSTWLAATAALLLLATPIHVLHSRMLVDNVYPIPFILAWLWGVLTFRERPNRLWALAIAGASLGVGFYSYHASVVTMPVLFGLTMVMLWLSGERTVRPFAAVATPFAICLAPLLPWLLLHPEHYSDHLRAFTVYDPALSPVRGAFDVLGYSSLQSRASLLWSYFDPTLLFLHGDSSVINSTHLTGVFLLPMAPLLIAGIVQAVTARSPTLWLVLAAFITAPLPAVLANQSSRAARMCAIVPVGVLLATLGAQWLAARGTRASRVALAALGTLTISAFFAFYLDYMTGYRERADTWFEGNVQGAMETAIAMDRERPAPRILIDRSIPFAQYFWDFYTLKANAQALTARTVVGDGSVEELSGFPSASLVIVRSASALDVMMSGASTFQPVADVRELDQEVSFRVFRRR